MGLKNMSKLFMLVIFIICSAAALASQMIYFQDFQYNNGTLSYLGVNLLTGYPIISQDWSLPYNLQLLSGNNELLYQGYFKIPNMVLAPPSPNPDEKSCPVELDNVNFSVSFPYYKKGALIKIMKDEQELFDIDVSDFSQYCGDSICQPNENPKSCPHDCVSAEELTKLGNPKTYLLWALVSILFAEMVIAIVWYFRKR